MPSVKKMAVQTNGNNSVSCGPIAIWNANKHLKSTKMPSLRSLVRECSVTQEYGTFHWDITRTMKKFHMYDGDTYTRDVFEVLRSLRAGLPVIVLYSWACENGDFEGAHYVLVSMKNGSITVWNDDTATKKSVHDEWSGFAKRLYDNPSVTYNGEEFVYPYFWPVNRAA
jgi:hypothetical protein